MDTVAIGLSGMQSAGTRIAVSAHNVANLLSENFRPQRVVQSSVAGGGSEARVDSAPAAESVDLAQEMIDQIVSKQQFKASARVVDVGLEMRGSLLDILA